MMKMRFSIPMTLALLMTVPIVAQQRGEEKHEERHEGPRANQGRVPAAPEKRASSARPEVEKHNGGRVNSVPHVSNNHWYGHDRPNDKRYVIAHPFEHGRFDHIGPSNHFRVERIDRDHHRFWFPGGVYFDIAPWDWDVAADWCWDCGDDFTVYDDPDHPGWYLVYNIHTGAYIHAQYMGS